MTDIVFKTKVESKTQPEVKDTAKPQAITVSKIPVPFMDYKTENTHPFSVDYFKLGTTWEDPDGGFVNEVNTIESFLQQKIQSGEIANSVDAVKEALKQIEKTTNMKKEERSVVKIGIIANYMRFLMDNKKIMNGLKHYYAST